MTKTGTQYVMAALMPSACKTKIEARVYKLQYKRPHNFLINFIDIQQQKDTMVNNTSAYGL